MCISQAHAVIYTHISNTRTCIYNYVYVYIYTHNYTYYIYVCELKQIWISHAQHVSWRVGKEKQSVFLSPRCQGALSFDPTFDEKKQQIENLSGFLSPPIVTSIAFPTWPWLCISQCYSMHFYTYIISPSFEEYLLPNNFWWVLHINFIHFDVQFFNFFRRPCISTSIDPCIFHANLACDEALFSRPLQKTFRRTPSSFGG